MSKSYTRRDKAPFKEQRRNKHLRRSLGLTGGKTNRQVERYITRDFEHKLRDGTIRVEGM